MADDNLSWPSMPAFPSYVDVTDESIETREVQGEVKPKLTIYDPQVIHNPGTITRSTRTVTYACGHDLVQSDRQVIPARCPHCGGAMYE